VDERDLPQATTLDMEPFFFFDVVGVVHRVML
jgi:hypothetical protein